jgi:hypothetical protein
MKVAPSEDVVDEKVVLVRECLAANMVVILRYPSVLLPDAVPTAVCSEVAADLIPVHPQIWSRIVRIVEERREIIDEHRAVFVAKQQEILR